MASPACRASWPSDRRTGLQRRAPDRGADRLYIILGCSSTASRWWCSPRRSILPSVKAANIDLLWFGISSCWWSEMAQITPPVGFKPLRAAGAHRQTCRGGEGSLPFSSDGRGRALIWISPSWSPSCRTGCSTCGKALSRKKTIRRARRRFHRASPHSAARDAGRCPFKPPDSVVTAEPKWRRALCKAASV